METTELNVAFDLGDIARGIIERLGIPDESADKNKVFLVWCNPESETCEEGDEDAPPPPEYLARFVTLDELEAMLQAGSRRFGFGPKSWQGWFKGQLYRRDNGGATATIVLSLSQYEWPKIGEF